MSYASALMGARIDEAASHGIHEAFGAREKFLEDLGFIRSKGNLGTKELSQTLGVSERCIERYFARKRTPNYEMFVMVTTMARDLRNSLPM